MPKPSIDSSSVATLPGNGQKQAPSWRSGVPTVVRPASRSVLWPPSSTSVSVLFLWVADDEGGSRLVWDRCIMLNRAMLVVRMRAAASLRHPARRRGYS